MEKFVQEFHISKLSARLPRILGIATLAMVSVPQALDDFIACGGMKVMVPQLMSANGKLIREVTPFAVRHIGVLGTVKC